MATIYGYARCSTSEDRQHIDRQINELKAAGAEEIYYEFEHGDSPVKKNLQALMENAEIQSSLIVTEVSRLSRSTQQLCELLKLIQNKQMRLIILNSIINGDRSFFQVHMIPF